MTGHRSDSHDNYVFYRIVWYLVAIAGLAERAASFSPRSRSAILWLLRPVEARVRRWLFSQTQDFSAPYAIIEGDTPADALALADRYMELAAILQDMLAYEEYLAQLNAVASFGQHMCPPCCGLCGCFGGALGQTPHYGRRPAARGPPGRTCPHAFSPKLSATSRISTERRAHSYALLCVRSTQEARFYRVGNPQKADTSK